MPTSNRLPVYIFVFLLGFFVTYLLLTLFYRVDQDTGPASIKVSGLWDKNVFNVIKEDFVKDHPDITLTYEQNGLPQYFDNLQAQLKTETAPDVFWWDSAWGLSLGSSLAPLPSFIMSASTYEKTFYPITKTDMKVGGNYVGLPLEIDGLALLYNKDILTSKNFATAPKTWTSLRADYVPSLTTLDQGRLVSSAIALGTTNNIENLADIAGLFMLQNGVKFTENNRLTLSSNTSNSKLAADALNFYFAFSKTDKTWDNTQPSSLEAFARGKTAMILLPAYKIHDLLTFARKENLTINFGVEPVPQLPSAPTVTWGRYWALGVNSQSASQRAAWEFANFVTSPDTLRKIAELEGKTDGFSRAYPRVDMAKEQTSNIYLSAYVAQAKQAKSWYLHEGTYDSLVTAPVVDELKKALSSIEKGTSADAALKTFVSGIDPFLNKYGISAPAATQ